MKQWIAIMEHRKFDRHHCILIFFIFATSIYAILTVGQLCKAILLEIIIIYILLYLKKYVLAGIFFIGNCVQCVNLCQTGRYFESITLLNITSAELLSFDYFVKTIVFTIIYISLFGLYIFLNKNNKIDKNFFPAVIVILSSIVAHYLFGVIPAGRFIDEVIIAHQILTLTRPRERRCRQKSRSRLLAQRCSAYPRRPVLSLVVRLSCRWRGGGNDKLNGLAHSCRIAGEAFNGNIFPRFHPRYSGLGNTEPFRYLRL